MSVSYRNLRNSSLGTRRKTLINFIFAYNIILGKAPFRKLKKYL